MRRLVALLALGAVACGPSAAQIRRAKTVRYKTSFATVWNVVADVLHREVRNFRIEDAVRGVIETEWRLVERRSGDPITDPKGTGSGGSVPAGTGSQQSRAVAELGMLPSGIFVRYKARVTGGGPWRVSVEIEAAEYRPGMAMLQPLRRGGPDEPHYVQTRLDRVYVRIYERLDGYAIADVAVAPPKPEALDTSRWNDLPLDAAQAVARAHAAATRRDLGTLRLLMAPEFTWSLGAEPSVDQAIAMWGADGEILRALARTLAAGCGHDAAADVIACPAGAVVDGEGARAGFQKQGGIWRFTFFLGGR